MLLVILAFVFIFFTIVMIIVALLSTFQIFLSTRKARVIGLILPAISFLWALYLVIDSAMQATSFSLKTIVSLFLFYNIPTLIFLLIYWIIYEIQKVFLKYKAKKEQSKIKTQQFFSAPTEPFSSTDSATNQNPKNS